LTTQYLYMVFRLLAPVFFFKFSILFAQNTEIPKDYFRSPMDIPLILSGSFGELRNNHFHSGLDIKTEGVEGKNIYAVAEGYISRVRVSGFGYGKALYITHPNGLVSVYAHLKSFNDSIGKFVKDYQYANETFDVDINPEPGLLSVKKGEIIAFSGNSGGSGGPHLHFEIRDEKTEHALNPLHFGFKITDNIKPIISEIIIYLIDELSSVNNAQKPLKVKTSGVSGKYNLQLQAPLIIHGKTGFGINTHDLANNSSNRLGVYSIELKVNGERIYYYEMKRFSFDDTRCLNTHVDYYHCKKYKTWYHRSIVAPNNTLTAYEDVKEGGIFNFSEDSIYQMEYIVKDFFGNTSVLNFDIKGISKPSIQPASRLSPKAVAFFKFNESNVFKNDLININFPAGVFYDDLHFEFSQAEPLPGSISPLFKVHHEYEPVHATYTLSIKLNSLPMHLRRKALVVHIDEKGGKTPVGGDLREETLTSSPKLLGNFSVMIDSIKPSITALNVPVGGNMTGLKEIRFKISDNLSGIKSFRGTLNGNWILMEWDPKNNLLYHSFEKNLPPGKYEFYLEVKDQRGNTAEYSIDIRR
jgi:hypothetical protein